MKSKQQRRGREKRTMTTKPRNRVLTFAEAITQNKKTARVWLELRDNIPILVWLKTDAYQWWVIPYNIGIDIFHIYTDDYGTKWRCWKKEPTPEEMQDTQWEESDG